MICTYRTMTKPISRRGQKVQINEIMDGEMFSEKMTSIPFWQRRGNDLWCLEPKFSSIFDKYPRIISTGYFPQKTDLGYTYFIR